MAQTEITHSQQQRAAQAVQTFRTAQNRMFTTLESEVHSQMAQAAGSYKTSMMRLQADLSQTQQAIAHQLDLMDQSMIDASTTYQRFDTQTSDETNQVQSQVGSGTITNLNGGIFNNV